MTQNNKESKRKIRIFDGILIISISLVFLLVLFGVFKEAGNAVRAFLVGTFGLSIYGIFFAAIVYAIYHMAGKKVLKRKRQIFDLALIFFFLILLIHLVTINGTSYIRKEEDFATGYLNIIKRTFNIPVNSNLPETAGGLISTIIIYPIAKLSIIAEYILVVALLILCIVSYCVKYIKFEPKSSILSKFKRKNLENVTYGEELYTGDINGNPTQEEFSQIKRNKNIQYTTIEEQERKSEEKVLEKNQKQQEVKKEETNNVFKDPTAGNIKTQSSNLSDDDKERKRSFDILFNNLNPKEEKEEEEVKSQEEKVELNEKEKALHTLYPQYYSEKETVKKDKEKEIKEVKEEKPKTKEDAIKEKLLKSYTTKEMMNYIHENIEVGNTKNNKKDNQYQQEFTKNENNNNIIETLFNPSQKEDIILEKENDVIDSNFSMEDLENIYKNDDNDFKVEEKEEIIIEEEKFEENTQVEKVENKFKFEPIVIKKQEKEVIEKKEEPKTKELVIFDKYVRPRIEDLDEPEPKIEQNEEAGKDVEIIEKLLEELCNIKDAKVVNYVVGPTFTRYEIDIPISITVSSISNKEKDIQMRLAAESIKIQAPIPGKNYVGIEVPNKKRSVVRFREIIESSAFQDTDAAISCAIGQDVDGKNYVIDISKMPHLLIAGGTGSGKSVGINSLLCSILFKHSPEDVRLILIDPKQVELAAYSELPHMLIPEAISDPKQVLNALDWAIQEMEDRYTLLKKEKCQKISQYNKIIDKTKTQKMPYILIVIDEVNDIMIRVGKSFEEKVTVLAQKARAAGIHIVLATQRPSREVITGTIKANLPAAIAYATSRAVDSIIILGEAGAEKLLGKGDLIFKDPSGNNGVRIQGCFIDNHEIRKVTDFVRENNRTYFDKSIEDRISKTEDEIEEIDTLKVEQENEDIRTEKTFREVLQFCIRQGRASASSIQSEFGMGFPKANRYINFFDKFGYIQKQAGNKGSEVIITQAQYDEMYSELNLNDQD